MPDNMSWGKKYNIFAKKFRKYVACRMVLGASLTTVWSRRQIEIQSKFLEVSKSKFVFIAYKSNYSKSPPITTKIGDYVFAGGNSRRDYGTLFEAVRGTGITVIVSSTDPSVYSHLDIPENVILLAAREPAFARLMAGSRFVVIPLMVQLMRGAGEGGTCDAMWHGRPVICVDNISAFEYVEEGVTGYVTLPGDVASLRKCIIELWNQPDKATQMGLAAHQSIETDNMKEHCMRRLRALGALVAAASE
jgi:glycosyltransferase involved in cell wall biosynthesis